MVGAGPQFVSTEVMEPLTQGIMLGGHWGALPLGRVEC